MEEPTPKLRQVTPEEFEQLLRGETVELSLEKNETLTCLTKNEFDVEVIQVIDLEVKGKTALKGNYPYPIEIAGKSSIGPVVISDTASTGYFWISGEATTGYFWISEKATTGYFSIYGEATTGDFSISEKATTGYFSIYEKATTGDFSIYEKATTGDFSIYEKATTGYFSIYGEATTGVFSIYGEATTGNFRISGEATTGGGGLYNQGSMKSLVIEGEATVPKWYFSGGTVAERLVIKDLETSELLFTGSGTKFPDEIRIENVSLNALRFVDFRAATTVMVTNVRPSGENSYLEFTRSSFKKLELIGNRFADFDQLVFENSDLTSAFMAGTDFPERVRTRSALPKSAVEKEEGKPAPEEATFIYKRRQAKLFFEQIKTVMTGQGNRTGSIRYQALELEEHYRLVRFWSRKSVLDKCTLWFNKYSNGFGTNWLRGLGFFFGVTVLLYWLLLIATPAVAAAWPWQMRWSGFNEYAVHYFDFINPTSHIWKRWDYIYLLENGPDAPEAASLRWGIKLLLLFSKIIIITIIYQIVQAFRKFGKQ